MDFSFDETQLAVHEAVRGVLKRDPLSGQTWPFLRSAGLHVLSFPTSWGGSGLGAVEVGIVAEALGEAAVVCPFLGAGIAGLVASRATETTISDWCRATASGDVTAISLGGSGRAGLPHAVPASTDGMVTLTADLRAAHCAEDVEWLITPTTAGPCLLDVRQPAVMSVPVTTSLGTEDLSAPTDIQYRLAGAKARPLFDDRKDSADVVTELQRTVFLSYASGLLKGALRLTTDHLKNRTQFGRPLATFQAASQEIADIYILSAALESVSLYCNWSIDHGEPADTALDSGLFMFAGEGRAAMQMCHHLHGGVGVDVTYPLHRYFSLTKDVVRHCGGERENLRRLGTRCSLD